MALLLILRADRRLEGVFVLFRPGFAVSLDALTADLRENARRMAINARIQGTAADLLKIAMIAVDRRLRDEFPDSALLLTVHDELVLEAPEGQAEAVGEMVKAEMEGVEELAVPLVVDVGRGASRYDAKG